MTQNQTSIILANTLQAYNKTHKQKLDYGLITNDGSNTKYLFSRSAKIKCTKSEAIDIIEFIAKVQAEKGASK